MLSRASQTFELSLASMPRSTKRSPERRVPSHCASLRHAGADQSDARHSWFRLLVFIGTVHSRCPVCCSPMKAYTVFAAMRPSCRQ